MLHTPSRRTWRIRRSGVHPQPILSPRHARNVAVAAAALLHAAVMLAAGAVFLSCCQCVRATGSGLARPSIFEWVGVRRIDGLLTQTLYRNGCMAGEVRALIRGGALHTRGSKRLSTSTIHLTAITPSYSPRAAAYRRRHVPAGPTWQLTLMCGSHP